MLTLKSIHILTISLITVVPHCISTPVPTNVETTSSVPPYSSIGVNNGNDISSFVQSSTIEQNPSTSSKSYSTQDASTNHQEDIIASTTQQNDTFEEDENISNSISPGPSTDDSTFITSTVKQDSTSNYITIKQDNREETVSSTEDGQQFHSTIKQNDLETTPFRGNENIQTSTTAKQDDTKTISEGIDSNTSSPQPTLFTNNGHSQLSTVSVMESSSNYSSDSTIETSSSDDPEERETTEEYSTDSNGKETMPLIQAESSTEKNIGRTVSECVVIALILSYIL